MSLLLGAAGVSPLWYLTRGTGVVALLLLTAAVVLGVVGTSRWSRPNWPRFATAGLHRSISLLVVLVLAIHIVTAELDPFAPIGWLAVVIPFLSGYRPIWLGLGTLAFDLLLALVLTSLMRNRIGYRAWRAIHWLAYVSWPVALVHGLGTGTDARLGWVVVLSGLCAAAVVAAGAWRLVQGWPSGAGARVLGGAAGALGILVIVAWAATGPLRPGWARRAGTPGSLLAGGGATSSGAGAGGAATSASPPSASRSSSPTASSPTGLPSAPFSAALSGTLSETGPSDTGTVTIRIVAALSQGATARLAVTLRGRRAEGGVALSASSVSLGPPGSPDLYRGRIGSLDGSRMVALLTSGAAAPLQLDISLHIDPSSGTVQGTLQAISPGDGGGNGA